MVLSKSRFITYIIINEKEITCNYNNAIITLWEKINIALNSEERNQVRYFYYLGNTVTEIKCCSLKIKIRVLTVAKGKLQHGVDCSMEH